jgi:importin subunit beta-1
MPELTDILQGCQNPDAAIRTQAEQALTHAQNTNFPQFALALATELHNEEKPINVRQLAGITFKNLLVAKEETLQNLKHDAWKQIDEASRSQVKTLLLQTLYSPVAISRHTAAQACAEVAAVEIPFQAWNEFLPTITDNITSASHPDEVKIATLECLGFSCERIASLEDENIPEIAPDITDKMLNVIVDGMQDTRADPIRLSAAVALRNSLLFTKKNMDNADERNIIMQSICQATQSKDIRVRAAAYECIVQIAFQYYDKLEDYMVTLFQLTTEAIKGDEESVALNAIEFWSTLCEEEMEIMDEVADGITGRTCMNYVSGALPNLGPLLTQTLTRQDEDAASDDEIWNISMAAATCLGLIANTTEDAVVPIIIPFVQQHIQSENWRFREAATMAFSSILDGPSTEVIGQFVNQSIPYLLTALSDTNVMVKDTTAWTIGRICELHVRSIPSETFPTLLQGLTQKLHGESPQVASQACYALHNLAAAFADDEAGATTGTNALSQFMPTLLEQLLKATDRTDADENNLRPAAFEAISVLIQNSAPDCMPILVNLTPAIVTRLQQSFTVSTLTNDDKEKKEGLQGLLCGLIQVLILKLEEKDVEPIADNIMTCLLQVLQIKNATCHQEAFSATSALCDKMEEKFNKYMKALAPFLVSGLRNYQAFHVCTIVVGLIGDISRSIEKEITIYCNEIMTALVELLQNKVLHRSVKPPVLSCFGDIAMAIGASFEPFLKMTLYMLVSASDIEVPPDDEDLMEYLQSLREGILEAYTGIIQGLKDGGRIQLIESKDVENMVALLEKIASEEDKDDEVVSKSVGLLGDLASAFGSHAKALLQRPFVQVLLNEASTSEDTGIRETCAWAQQEIRSAIQ